MARSKSSVGFLVRVATPADEQPISILLDASYSVLMRPYYDPSTLDCALPAITTASPRLLASGTYYVANAADDTTVGCGGWTRERPGSGEVEPELAHVRHFATHPTWTGLGVGRSIYAVCEREARNAGAKRFECYSSLNAEGFYASLGFERVEPIDVCFGPGASLPGVLMARII
jgi:GNAT superfamily N-acetyltransferase